MKNLQPWCGSFVCCKQYTGKLLSRIIKQGFKSLSSKVENHYFREQIKQFIKTSKSATSSIEIPEIVLLTDEEIDNAKTDMKPFMEK